MFTLFHYDCECECHDTTVRMLLSAAGGAALCRLHAFCSKLYHEHVVSKACSSFYSSAHALCTLACNAVLIAEHARSHARSLDGVRWAINKHDKVLSALLGDKSAQDSPRPGVAAGYSPLND